MINWKDLHKNITKEDYELIFKIVKITAWMVPGTKGELMMDLEVVHGNYGLDLCRLYDDLVDEDEKHLIDCQHDIIGIHNNLNRCTGILENCFVPRYSKEQ